MEEGTNEGSTVSTKPLTETEEKLVQLAHEIDDDTLALVNTILLEIIHHPYVSSVTTLTEYVEGIMEIRLKLSSAPEPKRGQKYR